MDLATWINSTESPSVISTSFSDSLYPAEIPVTHLTPKRSDFEVFDAPVIGRGIRALRAFERGTPIGAFTGLLTESVMQHTLQVTPTSHVYDPYFIGLLTHSCAPNTLLDMVRLELLALTDIKAGQILTLDYALTEDTLFRQFPCSCGSSNCRHWVTGRRETVNAEGRAYLAQLSSAS